MSIVEFVYVMEHSHIKIKKAISTLTRFEDCETLKKNNLKEFKILNFILSINKIIFKSTERPKVSSHFHKIIRLIATFITKLCVQHKH